MGKTGILFWGPSFPKTCNKSHMRVRKRQIINEKKPKKSRSCCKRA